MKVAYFIFLFIFFFSRISFGQSKLKTAFNTWYNQNVNSFSNNMYLCDCSNSMKPLSYRDILRLYKGKDSLLLRDFVEKGAVINIKPKTIQTYLGNRIKLLSMSQFEKLKPPKVKLTNCEKNVIKQLDSLNSILDRIDMNTDSLSYKKNKELENSLFKETCFLSYTSKLRKSKKRILYFSTTYYYNKKYLITYIYYNSLTDSFGYSEIY